MNMINRKYIVLSAVLIYSCALFIFTGCSIQEKNQLHHSSAGMTSTPQRFSLDESFLLRFPKLHPQNLAIKNPKGDWFYLQNSDDKLWIIEPAKFSESEELSINTSKLKGLNWKEGKKSYIKVFTEKGTYLIYMADNLETEPENTFHFSTTVTIID